jgi:hypothetical protein
VSDKEGENSSVPRPYEPGLAGSVLLIWPRKRRPARERPLTPRVENRQTLRARRAPSRREHRSATGENSATQKERPRPTFSC